MKRSNLIMVLAGITALIVARQMGWLRGIDGNVVSGLLLGVFGLAVYFLPSIIANRTKHGNGVFALNFFLGWTFIGWVVALSWALSGRDARPSAPAASPSVPPIEDGLAKLAALKEKGMLTDDEFVAAKRRMLVRDQR